MNNPLHYVLSVVLGMSIIVGGLALKTDNILASAKSAVNAENVHQLTIAVEMYNLDHGSYPQVSGGQALVATLEAGRYIQNQPLDPSDFNYTAENNGQNYTLSLK